MTAKQSRSQIVPSTRDYFCEEYIEKKKEGALEGDHPRCRKKFKNLKTP